MKKNQFSYGQFRSHFSMKCTDKYTHIFFRLQRLLASPNPRTVEWRRLRMIIWFVLARILATCKRLIFDRVLQKYLAELSSYGSTTFIHFQYRSHDDSLEAISHVPSDVQFFRRQATPSKTRQDSIGVNLLLKSSSIPIRRATQTKASPGKLDASDLAGIEFEDSNCWPINAPCNEFRSVVLFFYTKLITVYLVRSWFGQQHWCFKKGEHIIIRIDKITEGFRSITSTSKTYATLCNYSMTFKELYWYHFVIRISPILEWKFKVKGVSNCYWDPWVVLWSQTWNLWHSVYVNIIEEANDFLRQSVKAIVTGSKPVLIHNVENNLENSSVKSLYTAIQAIASQGLLIDKLKMSDKMNSKLKNMLFYACMCFSSYQVFPISRPQLEMALILGHIPLRQQILLLLVDPVKALAYQCPHFQLASSDQMGKKTIIREDLLTEFHQFLNHSTRKSQMILWSKLMMMKVVMWIVYPIMLYLS